VRGAIRAAPPLLEMELLELGCDPAFACAPGRPAEGAEGAYLSGRGAKDMTRDRQREAAKGCGSDWWFVAVAGVGEWG